MSYILDALKKSDQERKRGDVPNLQTVHIPLHTEQKTPWLLYGFISLLLLLLAFFIGMFISERQSHPLTDSPHSEAAPVNELIVADKDEKPDNVQTQIAARKPVNVSVAAKVQNDSTNVRDELQSVDRNEYVPANPSTSIDNSQPARVNPEVPVEVIAPEVNYQELPHLHELPEYQQQSIPDMKFAGHVYSSVANSRSVIINNYAMSEGDTLVQGLVLKSITPVGVVFSYQGNDFRVDILQDWSFE